MLIAPVEVGDSAYTGAGAVIKDDVPDGALAVSENEQRNIEGYAERKAARDAKRKTRLVSTIEERPAGGPTAIPHDYSKRMMVFGGRSSMELAAKVAGKLDLDLGQVTLKTFANGEVYCRYEESIRGADVFIVQSTCANEQTGMTPNDALVELLTMIDAAQGASAHRIIAVMPWYGYARQDKKSAPREPITARIVAKCLEGVGVDRVLTMDLHAGQVQGFFHVPVDHMTAMPMLTQWFVDQHLDRRAGDRLPRRRPGQDRAQLRPPGRHPLGGDGEGAPRPAGRRDRLRGRRRQGQDRGPRRRHDRHRRHPLRRRPDRARRGRRAGDRLRHPRRLLRPRLRAARLRELRRSSRSSSPTRCRCAPAPRTTSPCSRPPAPSPTRSAASSPTTRSPRSSPARTSCSRPPPITQPERSYSRIAGTGAFGLIRDRHSRYVTIYRVSIHDRKVFRCTTDTNHDMRAAPAAREFARSRGPRYGRGRGGRGPAAATSGPPSWPCWPSGRCTATR